MEVTISNYKEILAELDQIIPKATFLAIDGEFTGLKTAIIKNSPFDTPEEYYEKLLSGSVDFLLCQLGLSVFTFNNETERYTQRTYNFYVFPKPYNSGSPDCRFMCQASSIAFLSDQGFDFNKLFKHGIPYLTNDEEEKMLKKLEERNENKPENDILIPKKDQPRIDDICQQVEDFLKSDQNELTIPHCNAYIKKLMYQEIRQKWPNLVRLEPTQGTSLHFIRKGTVEEEEKRELERRDKEKQHVKDAVGLSTLMRMISDSGKLIVGHNMLFDMFHIAHQFFSKLPKSYSEFKALLHSLFPRLLDTKIICQSSNFQNIVLSSCLSDLFQIVSKPPFCLPEVDAVENYSYTISAEKSHEAGYDAYMTGLCFIALSNYLGSLEIPKISTVLADSPIMNQYLNKLLIARLKDIPYINLTGNDPIPNRDNVFHLTFPAVWKTSDISQLFKPFGDIQIGWINETSAYVKVYNKKEVAQVKKKLKGNEEYTIQSFSSYQSRRQNLSNKANEIADNGNKSQTSGNIVSTENLGNNVQDSGDNWRVAGNVSQEINTKCRRSARVPNRTRKRHSNKNSCDVQGVGQTCPSDAEKSAQPVTDETGESSKGTPSSRRQRNRKKPKETSTAKMAQQQSSEEHLSLADEIIYQDLYLDLFRDLTRISYPPMT